MKRYVSALAVALCLVSASANAATQHELLINSSFGTTANLKIGGGEEFMVKAGYLYSLAEMFQIGGVVNGGYNGAKEQIDLMVLANLNFAMNNGAFHSVFIGGGAGFNDLTSARQFAWRVDGGIRYKIFENVTWRPTLGVQDEGTGVEFNGQFLAMSLVF